MAKSAFGAPLCVYVGNQIVRQDYAPRQFDGVVFVLSDASSESCEDFVFTLPLNFEVLPSDFFTSFTSVVAPLMLSGDLTLQSLETFFRLAVVARIGNCITVGIGVELFESHIQTDGTSGWFYVLLAVALDAELSVVSIGSTYHSHSLDRVVGVVVTQVARAEKLEPSSLEPINKGDVLTIVALVSTRWFCTRPKPVADSS